jgi:murein DD-endopeptidase MepM/ murein hydrolase activator NlpD
MREDHSNDNNREEFTPWDEEKGGIQRTPGEESETRKLGTATKDPLEDLYHTPSATIYDRIRNQPDSTNFSDGAKSFWVGRKFKRRSSVITLLMLLFGTGGFLTVFFTPTLALSQLSSMMTQSLNDQFYAVQERSDMLMKAKLQEATKGSCGLVKIACRFATMNESQIKRFKNAGIEVDTKPSLLLRGRGQITEMRFTGADGNTIRITSAEQLHRMSLENIEFQAAKTRAFNPMFATMTDKVVTKVLQRLKARKLPVTGETDEERRKNLNSAVAGNTSGNGRPIVETEDEDGKKRFSVDGEEISNEQADGASSIANELKNITDSGGYKSFAQGTLRGLSALGYLQNACATYTLADVTSSLIQLERGAQAVRFAMTGALATESAMRAGEANEGDFNYVANLATTPTMETTAIDESKLDSTTTAESLPQITSQSTGKTAFDSLGYKYVAYQEVPESVSIEDSRFMLAGGAPTKLQTGLNAIATLTSPDNPTPEGVRSKCRIINHPLVVVGSLGLGIVLGAGSFGLTTAAGIAASVGFAMLTPYFMAQIADTMTGETFKDLSGKPFGEGVYVGTAHFLSSIARARGAKPLNKQEGIQYLEKNLAANIGYDETQRYIARSDPFNINNRYSFLGSLVYSAIPTVEKSKTNASAAIINVASIIPSALSSFNPAANAKVASIPESYLSCNDQRLLAIGVDADFLCVTHYGATAKEMQIQPVANALWMAETGNINPDSDTGDARDNGQEWNYVKFLDECVNRTTALGFSNESDEGDGRNCTDPEKENLNEQFRTYTMNKTIQDAMDTAPQPITIDTSEAYVDGSSGTVVAGWSFPTTDDSTISESFGTGEGRDKNGISIAAATPTETEGMPIYAARDGTVVAAGKESGLGNRIILNHWVDGKLISTVYGHLGDNSIAVDVGEEVKAGQQIGVVTAENNSTKARLYFEMWQGPTSTGQAVDPMGTLGATRRAKEVTNG